MKHFLDSNSKVNKDPKLFQIRLTIQNITSKLQNSYLPEENISTDGSINSWKGRLSLQLYIPLKASKFARRHMTYVYNRIQMHTRASWKFEKHKNCFQT
jgi:hypothetical protein